MKDKFDYVDVNPGKDHEKDHQFISFDNIYVPGESSKTPLSKKNQKLREDSFYMKYEFKDSEPTETWIYTNTE